MRVVTLRKFGVPDSELAKQGIPSDCLGIGEYVGDAYLFRFTVQSPEHFFRSELPHLLGQLHVTIASVYRLVLVGWPGTGLYKVRLYVSFEEPPDEEKFELLRMAVQPSEPLDHPGDNMQRLCIKFLRNARPSTKKNLARALEREDQDAKTAHWKRKQ